MLATLFASTLVASRILTVTLSPSTPSTMMTMMTFAIRSAAAVDVDERAPAAGLGLDLKQGLQRSPCRTRSSREDDVDDVLRVGGVEVMVASPGRVRRLGAVVVEATTVRSCLRRPTATGQLIGRRLDHRRARGLDLGPGRAASTLEEVDAGLRGAGDEIVAPSGLRPGPPTHVDAVEAAAAVDAENSGGRQIDEREAGRGSAAEQEPVADRRGAAGWERGDVGAGRSDGINSPIAALVGRTNFTV